MGVLKQLDLDGVQRERATDATDDWNVLRSGLNYVGFCRNKNCPVNSGGAAAASAAPRATGVTVTCNRRMGSSIVNDDVMTQRVVCPKCRSVFEIEHIVLFNCKATVSILDTTPSEDHYAPQGDEVVKLGARGESDQRRPGYDCLVEITTKPHQACAIM
eukprot:TRINITY_DN351_c0_g1_i1.p1 TRINITY_DN351_c0_g1~~TRINITY_DN351_c0_g1_i1.p1  ORF type:complete len:173 (-),score=10.79 TRINITY_DN351_c0_g1_i1:482-958(-)